MTEDTDRLHLRALRQVAYIIGKSKFSVEQMSSLLATCVSATRSHAAYLFLFHAESTEFELVSSYGATPSVTRTMARQPATHGVAGRALRNR